MLVSGARSQLLIVDVQERLAPAMSAMAAALSNIDRLARAARVMGVPISLSEQYPRGLGSTLPPILEACGQEPVVFSKTEFSCGRDRALSQRFAGLGRSQIVICGIEAHVCVLQSAIDLLAAGYDCFVVADASASRREQSKEIALRRMECSGVTLVTAEMVIFEWLERAGTAQFKQLAPLLK
ncbi:MAG TPA: isochorismatase family protein [Beijerinckiaceae bacterium]|nr:isochorismatase family protein [Beijerinckiaceae bacterium]